MHAAAEGTLERGTDPPPMRIQPSINGEPPVAGTHAGHPATTGAQRVAALHAGLGVRSDDEVRMKCSTDALS